ncbi:MAG: DMT family transporter [Sphaerochaetaceae bacterium]|nr:DMT family transporter [Sphaerochaetaceae bacterium]
MTDDNGGVLTRTWAVCLLATICCVLWGSAFPCIKIGYRLFSISSDATASQILFAGCRFIIAGIMTVLIGCVARRRLLVPSLRTWWKIGKISLIQTVAQYLFFYIGLAHASGVKSSIIEASSTFFAILLASLVFRQEKLTAKKIAGCLIGFAGVVLVNLSGGDLDMRFSFNGEGFVLISALAYALSSVLIKRYSVDDDPVLISGYQFLVGGTVLVLCGLAFGGNLPRITGAGLAMLCYLASISAVAYTVWGILLKYNPVSKVTIFGFMNPMFGVVLSILLLDEGGQSFGLRGVVALLLVSGGIFIVNMKWTKRPVSGSAT